jgi:hypothetical protein
VPKEHGLERIVGFGRIVEHVAEVTE